MSVQAAQGFSNILRSICDFQDLSRTEPAAKVNCIQDHNLQ